MKYVLVTGGVVSGLGKGVTASSIGLILKACGLRVTSIKIGLFFIPCLWFYLLLHSYVCVSIFGTHSLMFSNQFASNRSSLKRHLLAFLVVKSLKAEKK